MEVWKTLPGSVIQAVAEIVMRREMEKYETKKFGQIENSPVINIVVLLQWALRPEK